MICGSLFIDDTSYYSILGLYYGSSEVEIRKAYKKLAIELHPDKSKSNAAGEVFKLVNHAYSQLMDEEKRKKYNQQLISLGLDKYVPRPYVNNEKHNEKAFARMNSNEQYPDKSSNGNNNTRDLQKEVPNGISATEELRGKAGNGINSRTTPTNFGSTNSRQQEKPNGYHFGNREEKESSEEGTRKCASDGKWQEPKPSDKRNSDSFSEENASKIPKKGSPIRKSPRSPLGTAFNECYNDNNRWRSMADRGNDPRMAKRSTKRMDKPFPMKTNSRIDPETSRADDQFNRQQGIFNMQNIEEELEALRNGWDSHFPRHFAGMPAGNFSSEDTYAANVDYGNNNAFMGSYSPYNMPPNAANMHNANMGASVDPYPPNNVPPNAANMQHRNKSSFMGSYPSSNVQPDKANMQDVNMNTFMGPHSSNNVPPNLSEPSHPAPVFYTADPISAMESAIDSSIGYVQLPQFPNLQCNMYDLLEVERCRDRIFQFYQESNAIRRRLLDVCIQRCQCDEKLMPRWLRMENIPNFITCKDYDMWLEGLIMDLHTRQNVVADRWKAIIEKVHEIHNIKIS